MTLGRFDSLEQIRDGLIVQDNPRLPGCQVDALREVTEDSYALVEDNADCQ